MEQEENKMEEKLNFQTMNDDVLTEIFNFLTLKDIEWKKCTEKPFIWRRVQYDFQDNQIADKEQYIDWFIKKVTTYKVQQLIINDPNCHLTFQNIYSIFSVPQTSLRELEISLYNLSQQQACMICLLIVKFCPNLQSFTTYGTFITDKFMEHFSLLNNLQSFSIMCNDNQFTGINLRILPPLKKLFLRPYLVEYDNIIDTIRKGRETLLELAIDTEQMDDNQVIKLFSELNKNKIETLLLNYCEYFTDEVFSHLQEFQNLKRLKFYKANEVTQQGYLNCFNNFSSTSLIHLNLKECNELDDEGLIAILSKSKQLECLKLSWQKYITSQSIRYLFENCLNLQTCILLGIKSLDANGFPEIQDLLTYFNTQRYSELKRNNQYQDDQNNDCINNDGYLQIHIQDYFTKNIDRNSISLYQKLRLIDCTKSDMVPDEILQILHVFKPYLVAHNYYGEKM